MDKLRREHHDSPLAIAENRRRNRETASLRLVHLQRELTTLENFVLDRAAMLADVANLDERQHGHVILQRKNWLAEATARRDEKLREVERLTESATEVELVEV